MSARPRPVQRRQQQPRQNSNNCDHHQEFDQGETASAAESRGVGRWGTRGGSSPPRTPPGRTSASASRAGRFALSARGEQGDGGELGRRGREKIREIFCRAFRRKAESTTKHFAPFARRGEAGGTAGRGETIARRGEAGGTAGRGGTVASRGEAGRTVKRFGADGRAKDNMDETDEVRARSANLLHEVILSLEFFTGIDSPLRRVPETGGRYGPAFREPAVPESIFGNRKNSGKRRRPGAGKGKESANRRKFRKRYGREARRGSRNGLRLRNLRRGEKAGTDRAVQLRVRRNSGAVPGAEYSRTAPRLPVSALPRPVMKKRVEALGEREKRHTAEQQETPEAGATQTQKPILPDFPAARMTREAGGNRTTSSPVQSYRTRPADAAPPARPRSRLPAGSSPGSQSSPGR